MATQFKLLFEGEPDLKIDMFQQSLPTCFQVEERDDGIYVTIESAVAEDKICQYLIDRELDRIFFITSVKIRAEMVRAVTFATHTFCWGSHGSLPDNIRPQTWNYKLPIQLRLWSIATSIAKDSDEVVLKLILLFQIIELEYPEKKYYQEYKDATKAPDPLTECKLIRHLVAHSGNVCGKELKKYCAYIGLPEVMLDITDPQYKGIIAAKVRLMETEAKNVIAKAL